MKLQKAFGRGTMALAVILGIVISVGASLRPAGALQSLTVKIENFSFVPETITIPTGTAITWENGDDIPHSVVLSDKSFRSKPLDTHDKTTFTFTKSGTVTYFCGLHPHMQGKIIVLP